MPFSDAIRIGASGAAGDFEVDRSIRYDRANNSYFSKQPSSAGNRRTFTISTWVKRSNTGVHGALFYAGTSVGANHDDTDSFRFNPSDQLIFEGEESQTVKYQITTNRKFRDPSAWYHIVLAVDTTQSTSSNRIKFYVNGVQETSLATTTYPSQNYELFVNSTVSGGYTNGNIHVVGYTGGGRGLDGYLAEYHLIDGQQLTPASFAETKATTGEWIPIDTSGLTYGTNGFRLQFLDNSGTTATTLGKDTSGNSNNYTPSNFSVSAGTGNDSLEDTPTNNFCTLNALHKDSNTTLSEGNLKAAGSSSTAYATNTQATFAQSSGKWYYEVEYTSNAGGTNSDLLAVGWARTTLRFSDNPTLSGGLCYRPAHADYIDLSGNDTSDDKPQTSTGNVIQVAIDLDNGKIWFGNGGTFFESGNPATGANANITFTGGAELLSPFVRTLSSTLNFNFGQRAFSYTPPTGYKALNSANLPDPTILLPNKHFDTLLYTGNGGSHSVTGLQFQPDWLWIKNRGQTDNHQLHDAVRGPSKGLHSNLTNAEFTDANAVTAFNSNGFSMNNNYDSHNKSSETYVAWNWDAGETDSATYRVVVVSDSGNKYRFRNSANSATFAQSAVTLDLAEGGTYTFDQSDSTMSSHPMKLSTTANGTHGGGSSYNTGVTYELDGSSVTESAFVSGFSSATSRKLIITVAASAPTLYYYCHYHSGMGGQANTNSTLGSSNFDGSNQTTVKANTTSGFSIVTWTGTGSVASMGHGLGVAPDTVIIKTRSATNNWVVYHQSTGTSKYLHLSTTDAASTASNYFADDSGNGPSSTVFYGRNDGNTSSQTMVAYCLSEVEGYSKFGSYTSNGNVDGAFVFTGFRPAWVMLKQSSNSDTSYWFMFDSTRSPKNVIGDEALAANLNEVEGLTSWNPNTSNSVIDFVSNGFKIRTTSTAGFNVSGETMIYYAFAESPFKNSRAR
jgi:hypothetical protein